MSSCNEFRESLANGNARKPDSSHSDGCESCRSLAAALSGAEAALRADGVPVLPEGFAVKAARAAMRAPRKPTESLLDRFFPIAIPAAGLAVVAAVLVFFGIGWEQPAQMSDIALPIDPVSEATETPVALADPTPEILGVGD